MTIPDFESIMLPLLENVKDGREHRMIEVETKLANHFNLTEDERLQLQPSGRETLFQNRARWARLYLKKAGLLEDPRRGYTKITKRGLEVLQQGNQKIEIKFLTRYPEFVSFYSRKKDLQTSEGAWTHAGTISIEPSGKTPEDMISEGLGAIRTTVEAEILARLMENPPEFFEKVVLELVRKMGYGIDHQVLGRTGDGGIDGVIREDKLGLDEIYFQAKRWKSTVPVAQVRDFAGALLAKKSKKGIFITTSDFSTDAYNFVKETADLKIILINGEQLAKLMFDHNLGVTTIGVYELKNIDEDYFVE